MATKQDVFSAGVGFSISGGSSLLSASGAPGGDSGPQDAAKLGSLYLRTDTGSIYSKVTSTNSTADWNIIVSNDVSSFSAVNGEATSLIICTPVVLTSGQFLKADATSSSKIRVAGLVLDTTIASSASGYIQTTGIFSASTAQWDAVTGGSGGLTPGPIYLSIVTGKLTSTAPTSTSQFIVEIGLALSSTKLRLQVLAPIAL